MTSAGIRAMLAANEDWNEAKVAAHLKTDGYLILQPKFDGMRMIVSAAGNAMSRSWKLLGSSALQRFTRDTYECLAWSDGEVMSGHTQDDNSFREGMSTIRASTGGHAYTYYVFDTLEEGLRGAAYIRRREAIEARCNDLRFQSSEYDVMVKLCPQWPIYSLKELYDREQELLAAGYEGGIIRRAGLPYKFGRSSFTQGHLLKLKRFKDAEAVVVGYEPWYQNGNEPTINALGFQVRSAHQENLIELPRLGALKVELLEDRSVKFNIGVMRGITHEDRDELWRVRETLLGRICTFKHQGYGGGYDAPRTPVWLKWREPADLG